MKILVTGGTGFFGKALLKHWNTLPEFGNGSFEVTVLSRSPEIFNKNWPNGNTCSWLHFHKGDVTIPNSLPQDANFDYIIHAATDSTLGPTKEPLNRFIDIVDGTRNILDFSIRSNTKKLLLTSSGGVYGQQPNNMNAIPEEYLGIADPLNPESAYSIAKRMAEHLCALYAKKYGIETVIARCFTFSGEDIPQNAHFAIGNFVRDAILKNNISVNSNGSAIRSYMDQHDLAKWIWKILIDGVSGEAYNVGSDKPISIKELAYKVRSLLSPESQVIFRNSTTDINQRNIYIPDVSKCRYLLGLKIETTIEESILKMANNQLAQ